MGSWVRIPPCPPKNTGTHPGVCIFCLGGIRTGAVVNGAPGEKRRAAAGSRWRHGAFSAAAAFARLCERRLAKAKCGKVESRDPACRSAGQIIHTGTIYVLLSIALNFSRRQMIAPVPLGTEALSSSLKAPVICVGGLMLFLISMGCS